MLRAGITFGRELICLAVLASCGGGGGGSSSPPVSDPPQQVDPDPIEDPSPAFDTRESTARFLGIATFGPTEAQLDQLPGTSPSQWVVDEFAKPATLNMPIVDEFQSRIADIQFNFISSQSPTFAFWRNAVGADDQLRQRVAFALSEILVVSDIGSDSLKNFPGAMAYHMDVLTLEAFGNYRDLLEQVTYSPAMGIYLTYLNNKKADPDTGRMPDENYAREILQLFTIGLVELGPDGQPVIGETGGAVELYDNMDITGLAKVFTGLVLDFSATASDAEIRQSFRQPMVVLADDHSSAEKAFLDLVIPPGTPAEESLDLTLDHIIAHPNIGPFVGRQLIQRLVTSDPEADYVQRVASAFDAGTYTLPDGQIVGDGRKGDMQATIAAILFDPDIHEGPASPDQFGKIREPILRFSAWARAFGVDQLTAEASPILFDTSSSAALGQHPYRSPSVFNFFRPGYIAPGTRTGTVGMTVPELQIVNSSTIPGYANFMTFFVFEEPLNSNVDALQDFYDEQGAQLDATAALTSFLPDYTDARSLADNSAELLDFLDERLTYGQLSDETRAGIIELIDLFPVDTDENIDFRMKAATLMVLTSPDFIVQR